MRQLTPPSVTTLQRSEHLAVVPVTSVSCGGVRAEAM